MIRLSFELDKKRIVGLPPKSECWVKTQKGSRKVTW